MCLNTVYTFFFNWESECSFHNVEINLLLLFRNLKKKKITNWKSFVDICCCFFFMTFLWQIRLYSNKLIIVVLVICYLLLVISITEGDWKVIVVTEKSVKQGHVVLVIYGSKENSTRVVLNAKGEEHLLQAGCQDEFKVCQFSLKKPTKNNKSNILGYCFWTMNYKLFDDFFAEAFSLQISSLSNFSIIIKVHKFIHFLTIALLMLKALFWIKKRLNFP